MSCLFDFIDEIAFSTSDEAVEWTSRLCRFGLLLSIVDGFFGLLVHRALLTENDTALYLLLVIGIMMVMCLNSCILCYLFMPLVDLILLFQVLGNVIMIGVCALVLLSDNKYIEAPVRNTFAVPLISFHVLEMLIGIILIVILIKSNSHKKVFLCCRPMNRTITGNDSDIPLHMVISSP